jgi:hypothetical protein
MEKTMSGYTVVNRTRTNVSQPTWEREKCFKSADLIHYTGEHYATFSKRATTPAGQIVWSDEVKLGSQRVFDSYEAFQLLVHHRLMKAGLSCAMAASVVLNLKNTFLPDEVLFCLLRAAAPAVCELSGEYSEEFVKAWLLWKKDYEEKRDAILKMARDGTNQKLNKEADDFSTSPVFYSHCGKITDFEKLFLDPANKAVLVIDVHSVQRDVEAIRKLNWTRKNARAA